MKISVITVSYNSAATLGDTLKSVKSQTHPDIEHILIDGGSTDGTTDLIARHGGHLARYITEPDGGIYDAMNKGLALATGDIVGFLNSDDVFAAASSLSEIANGFAAADVDAVYGDIIMVDPLQLQTIRRYWRPGNFKAGAFTRGWMAPHPTLYVRRDLLQSSGGFNLDYRLQSDFDLELRLFECMKIRAVYLPRTLVRMRMGGATTGSLRNILRGNLEAAKSAERNGFPGGWRFIASKVASRLSQYWARPGKA
jgi:glycosyltransferase involved in cell wall biosynthesis